MAVEIERKFLIRDERWRSEVAAQQVLKQGYLNDDPARSVRVRVAGEQAFLTIKGKGRGISRSEFEYAIPLADAESLLGLCPSLIEKTRYRVPQGKLVWEIDVFEGNNAGLVVAEIELPAEDAAFEQPDWLGPEVSGDNRYYNSQLSLHPYTQWTDHS